MKISSRIISLSIILMITNQSLNANSTIDDFLSEYETNTEEIISPDVSQPSENKFNFNIIEKAKLSVEHSHFSDVERDYEIKLYTKSFSEAENEEIIYNLKRDLFLKKDLLAKNKILKNRYETLIETIYQHRVITLINKEINIEKKNLKITKAMAEKESDILKIYNIQDDINNLNLKKFQLKQENNIFLENISLILNDININEIEKEISENIFINPSTVIDYISQNIDTLSVDIKNSLFLKSNADKMNLSKHKLDLIESKNSLKLDSVRLKFDDSKKSKNAFSIGVSVEMPIASNDSKVMNEKLKFLSLQSKANKNIQNIQNRVKKLKIDIKYLSEYLKKIDNQINRSTISKDRNSYYKIKLSLKIKQKNIKLEKAKAKIVHQILQKYINILYMTDTIKESELKNLIQNREVS